jgi:hypothetical protein
VQAKPKESQCVTPFPHCFFVTSCAGTPPKLWPRRRGSCSRRTTRACTPVYTCACCALAPRPLSSSSISDLPLAPKPQPAAAEYKSDAYYGGKYEEKKQDLSALGLDGFSALQKKDKNPYSNMGMGGAGSYDEKKDRKDGGGGALGGSFGQKAAVAAPVDKYGLGSVVGSKWDAPLPSAKDMPLSNGGNFPSVAGGRSSFIRNARYAPGVNPSSVLPPPPLPPPACPSQHDPPSQVSPTPAAGGMGAAAFGVKAPAAAGMRNDTLDSMLNRNSQLPAAGFGMRPSYGQAGQLPSVAPPPQSGFGNKWGGGAAGGGGGGGGAPPPQRGFGNKCPPPPPPPPPLPVVLLVSLSARLTCRQGLRRLRPAEVLRLSMEAPAQRRSAAHVSSDAPCKLIFIWDFLRRRPSAVS